MIDVLEEKVQTSICKHQTDSLIIDGSSLVYSLHPTETTFEGYANNVFANKIKQYAQKHQRVDVVFDQYQYDPASLKSYTREQRGVGVRRKVSPTGKLPKDWNTFLRNDTNKTELFSLLADRIYQNENGIVYATKNSSSISNKMLCSCA